LENQRDKLSQQLEELFQVRKTDAEQAFDDLTVLYENRSKSERNRLRDIPANLSLVPLHHNYLFSPRNPHIGSSISTRLPIALLSDI